VLANYQTSYAQIGRQLSFTATRAALQPPRRRRLRLPSMPMNRQVVRSIPGPGATDPAFNTSRVANHDTTTRVRVDSIKLFEVSSFSAIVERSRSRLPLLPPFVEIPYIGTFAGIPLGQPKSSTAARRSSAPMSFQQPPTSPTASISFPISRSMASTPAHAASLRGQPVQM
jgi:hypothetical protein